MAAFGILAFLVLALLVALIAVLVWAVRRPSSVRADEGGPGSTPPPTMTPWEQHW